MENILVKIIFDQKIYWETKLSQALLVIKFLLF